VHALRRRGGRRVVLEIDAIGEQAVGGDEVRGAEARARSLGVGVDRRHEVVGVLPEEVAAVIRAKTVGVGRMAEDRIKNVEVVGSKWLDDEPVGLGTADESSDESHRYGRRDEDCRGKENSGRNRFTGWYSSQRGLNGVNCLK